MRRLPSRLALTTCLAVLAFTPMLQAAPAALEREVKVAPQGRDGGATNLKDHLWGF